MPETKNRFYIIRAWLVHFYTSLGLVIALLSLIALLNNQPQRVFILWGIAMFIDSTDGVMARGFKVKYYVPEFDGRKLDDITDYINYTFIPIFFSVHFGLVQGWGIAAAGVALILAAYGFCRDLAKTTDGFFTGFPNYWNLLVFYLFFFHASPTVTALMLLLFAFLIFVPIEFPSFSAPRYRTLSVALLIVFGVMLGAIVLTGPEPHPLLLYGSLFYPLYYTAISVYMTLTKRPAAA